MSGKQQIIQKLLSKIRHIEVKELRDVWIETKYEQLKQRVTDAEEEHSTNNHKVCLAGS